MYMCVSMMYIQTCSYIHIYIYMYSCTYVYIIYIYIHMLAEKMG